MLNPIPAFAEFWMQLSRSLSILFIWIVMPLSSANLVASTPDLLSCTRNAAVVSTRYESAGTSAKLIWSDGRADEYNLTTGALTNSYQLEGNNSTLLSVAWSPDGKYILAGSQSGSVQKWAVGTGKFIWNMPDPTRDAAVVAWSPDGMTFLTAAHGVTLWEANTGKFVRTMQEDIYVVTMVWSPDSNTIVTGSTDGVARISDVNTGSLVRSLPGHTQGVWSVAWSPDGKTIATSSQDGTIYLWEVSTGVQLIKFQGHKGMVRSIAWSPDGNRLLTGGDDHLARIWESKTGLLLKTLRRHTREIWNVEWSPDTKTVLTSGLDGVAILWNASSGKLLHSLCPRTT